MNKKTIISVMLSIILVGLLAYGGYIFNMNRQPVSEDMKKIPADKMISMTQLQSNKTKDSCWTSVDKKVYNVTSYVGKHPGGVELYNGCGKEISNLFPKHPGGRFNSEKNLQILSNLYIGDLK
jgi:cytochrome b involved in lipid metabolism